MHGKPIIRNSIFRDYSYLPNEHIVALRDVYELRSLYFADYVARVKARAFLILNFTV